MTSRLSPRALVASIALVVLLAGCASEELVEAADPVPTVRPTPSATPHQAQETGDKQPNQLYGGDCSSVAATSDLVASADQPLQPVGEWPGLPRSFGDDFAVRQVGGLECAWIGKAGFGAVAVTIVPVNAVPVRTAEPCRAGSAEYEQGDFVCELETTTDDLRLSGRVSLMGGSLASATQRSEAVFEVLRSGAAATATLPVPLPADGAWANPLDCRILEPVLTNPDILGGSPQPLLGLSGGTDVYFSPANVYLTGLGAEPARLQCSIYTKTDPTAAQEAAGRLPYLEFSALGGAAWVKDIIEARPDSSPIDIPGADAALLVDDEDYGVWFAVFDGPNYLSMRTRGDYRDYLVPASLLLETLNANA